MLESVAHWIQDFIRTVGYPGVLLLIIMESTLVPVPSTLVMPFVGFLASPASPAKGEFSLAVILVMNSVGALAGSGLSYWLGVVGGRPFLVKYGKYFLIKQQDIERTEAFFAKHGNKTILIARFLPVVRHVISVPAGIARMPLPGFFLLTFIGATLWGGGLILVGYYVGENWEAISKALKRVDLLIATILVLGLVALGIRFVVRRRREQR